LPQTCIPFQQLSEMLHRLLALIPLVHEVGEQLQMILSLIITTAIFCKFGIFVDNQPASPNDFLALFAPHPFC
jgi:hypothetical protein